MLPRTISTGRKWKKPPKPDRFWQYVPMTAGDGCWLWQGPIRGDGYGIARYQNDSWTAHRVAWMILKGPLPKGRNNYVCHTCDVRACVNPRHLFLGTARDNNRDCHAKGRNRGGNGAGKITRPQVEEMLQLAMRGFTGIEIAKRFGLSHRNVHLILNGDRWLDVPRPEGFVWKSREEWRHFRAGGNGCSPKRLAAIRRTLEVEHTCACGRIVKGNSIGSHRKACPAARMVAHG